METGTIILIIVIALVVLAVIAIAGMLAKKRQATQHREEAAELRQDAHAQTGGIQQSEMEAREAQLEADRARMQAEQSQAQAEQAQQGHAQERAQHEDQIREADQVDPDVDHRSDDYQPGLTEPSTSTTGTTGTTTSATGDPQATQDPVHETPADHDEGTTPRT